MSNTKQPKYPFKIVPFFLDYGFKVAFASDNPFSRKAIEILADLPAPVLRLQMLRNEGYVLGSTGGRL